MYSQLLIQEMVKAAQGERGLTDAPRNWSENGSYRTDTSSLATGARYVIGNALVRAGRSLQGATAPRPEPAGS